MKRLKELMSECKNRNLNCSFTYQRINDFSVEIYTGYETSYRNIFYTDGHIKPSKAIKTALKYLNSLQ